jgi:hypothetical protein
LISHEEWLQRSVEVDVDQEHRAQPAPPGRRLLVRRGLLAFRSGLLLRLPSRPAGAERLKLLDPVSTTFKATAKNVDSVAGRATGSRSSTVASTVLGPLGRGRARLERSGMRSRSSLPRIAPA